MGAARSAGGMRFKVGRKEAPSVLPTSRESREIAKAIARRAEGETFARGTDFRRGMKWFSEYERILDLPDAWSVERAQAVLEMMARLIRKQDGRAAMQKRASTIFYCLAILARQHGISPRGIVSVEPFGYAPTGRKKKA